MHTQNAPPFDVLLGQFGRIFYPVRSYQPWSIEAAPLSDATYFTQTGHNLRGSFRAYGEANGDLPQFGFPLTEEIRERLEDGKEYTVQYFERARFEYHPENPVPYAVLLGQFGRRILDACGANRAALPFPIARGLGQIYEHNPDVGARLGLPTGNAITVAGAFQPSQYGPMLYWTDTRTIYVSDGGSPGNWSSYADEWDERQPVGGGPAPIPPRARLRQALA